MNSATQPIKSNGRLSDSKILLRMNLDRKQTKKKEMVELIHPAINWNSIDSWTNQIDNLHGISCEEENPRRHNWYARGRP